jgi:hypothetical protein
MAVFTRAPHVAAVLMMPGPGWRKQTGKHGDKAKLRTKPWIKREQPIPMDRRAMHRDVLAIIVTANRSAMR